MSFDSHDTHSTFARYNAWMNEKLLDLCSMLGDEDRKKSLSVPFGSLHGLWNHLIVADNLWLSRIEATPLPFVFQGLNMEIYSDWNELKAARIVLDERLKNLAASLTPERLASDLHWVPATNPAPRTVPLIVVMSHIWNHQTHHRGQITAVIELLGFDCGVTDLLAMPGVVST